MRGVMTRGYGGVMTRNLTKRERDRLSDLLAMWTETDDPNLTGADRDAIGQLRYLLDDLDPGRGE